MSDNTSVKPDADETRRQREQVEKLLAMPPVWSTGIAHLTRGSIDYEVQCGFVPVSLPALNGKPEGPQAAVFTTAYKRKGVAAMDRPVCFAFNGGPGSASVWLHLGALGPKRVAIHEDGTMPPPPYAVVDNPSTWLDHFDLVFIDPPHTGWSMAASDDARKTMLSVDGDVEALAEVVRAWLTQHQRWASPLYLVGESYGTTRGAAMADKLLDLGIALRGLILVSCAMDLQTLDFKPGNELPHALFLPGFACVAQYHGKLKGPAAQSPAAARREAETFVQEDYLAALHAGSRLSGDARSRIARRMADLTGLPQAFVESKNLRISDECFFANLLRDEGRIVGRLEARVSGPMGASRADGADFDPGIEAIVAPYAMAAQAYFQDVLGIRQDSRYQLLNFEVNKGWNWNRGTAQGNGFTCTSPDLARAMRRNPHMKVLVASGHYDLGTPYSASDYSLAHLDIDAQVQERITHHYYDADHMMYTRPADLQKMKDDLVAWLG